MGTIIAKLLVGLGMKLITERVFAKMFVLSARALADKTTNKIDNEMVETIAEALDVKLQ